MKKFLVSLAFTALALSAAPGVLAAPEVSPLEFGVAIERGDIGQVRKWLDAGLSPDYVGDRFGTGLMIAAWEGNIPMMELFLSRGGRIDFTNKSGEQALQLAAFKGQFEAVKWLLARGAPLNRNGREWTALHYAVFNGHRELADYLIKAGADVNARVPNDATPLMLAAREGHTAIADDLIKAGADPRLTNDRGENAAQWAAAHGNLAIAQLVSTPEAFANIARNAPTQLAPRSVAAPNQIDDLLRRIRYAEAQNLPTAGLRKALMTAVERARMEAKRNQKLAEQREASAVKGVVITAKRSPSAAERGAEKVELISDKAAPPAAAAPATPTSVAAPVSPPVTAAPASEDDKRITLLLAKIRAAKANGQPTDALRKELLDAVSGYKKSE